LATVAHWQLATEMVDYVALPNRLYHKGAPQNLSHFKVKASWPYLDFANIVALIFDAIE